MQFITLLLATVLSVGSIDGFKLINSSIVEDESYINHNKNVSNETIDWEETFKDIDIKNINNNSINDSSNLKLLPKKSNSNQVNNYFPSIPWIYNSNSESYAFDYGVDSVLIENYEYFQNLRNFGMNSNIAIDDDGTVHFRDNYIMGNTSNPDSMVGVCGYVAVQMILGYYNTFYIDKIIPSSNMVYGQVTGENPFPLQYTSFVKPDYSPGSDHQFLRALYDYGPSDSNFIKNPRFLQFPWMIKKILDSWMSFLTSSESIYLPYTIKERHYDEIDDLAITQLSINMSAAFLVGGIFAALLTLTAWIGDHLSISDSQRSIVNSEAKALLDTGVPVIMTFFNPDFNDMLSHVVVAYGYTNDGRYIVNNGWGARSLMKYGNNDNLETINCSDSNQRIVTIDESYAIAYTAMEMPRINKINAHKHIYSYKKDNLDLYCSCGHKKGEDLLSTLKNVDYGYREEYNWNPEIKDVVTNLGDYVRTRRLRTGFIEDKYITLSAKRNNAGRAYLEYHYQFDIKKINWQMALWSNNESLALNSSIRLESYYNSEWNVEEAFEYSQLSKNKDVLFDYSYTFSNHISAFRIIIDTNSVQNENNRGRLVLGDVSAIDYSC